MIYWQGSHKKGQSGFNHLNLTKFDESKLKSGKIQPFCPILDQFCKLLDQDKINCRLFFWKLIQFLQRFNYFLLVTFIKSILNKKYFQILWFFSCFSIELQFWPILTILTIKTRFKPFSTGGLVFFNFDRSKYQPCLFYI